MPGKTNNLRDKLEDNQLDLSLMQLTEVPVQEIVSVTLSKGPIKLIHVLLTRRVNCRKVPIWICPIIT